MFRDFCPGLRVGVLTKKTAGAMVLDRDWSSIMAGFFGSNGGLGWQGG